MNHKWQNNKCTKCGINRKRKTRKLLMAITYYPPYDHYKYDYLWVYWHDNEIVGTYKRPECK